MRRLALIPQLAVSALVLAPALGPGAFAQRSTFAPSHFIAPARTSARYAPRTAGSLPFNMSFRTLRQLYRSTPYSSFFLPSGAPDSGDMDNLFGSGYPIAAQPAVFMMQAAPMITTGDRNQPQPLPQPLLIELRGDHYVRLTDGETAAADSRDPSASTVLIRPEKTASSGGNAADARQPSRELPPAVLVFRDGRVEQVRDYAIVSGVIYARGNYYTDGYWNKKIELSELNLPETIQSNAARGVRFVLPGAANEVVTRP